jgi:transcriptional regulator with XRE-family HTH domain
VKEDIGRYLVKLRIAKGWGPRQLANALNVDEALISRDERDEYQGITKERAQRILDVLGVQAYIVPLFQRPPATLELPNVLSPRQLATVIRADPYSNKQFPGSSDSLGGISALGRNTVFAPAKELDPMDTGSDGKSIFPLLQGVITAGRNTQQSIVQL